MQNQKVSDIYKNRRKNELQGKVKINSAVRVATERAS